MKILSLSSIAAATVALLVSAVHVFADVPEPPAVVPEPATMSLLAAGAGMYLLNRRRRK